MTQGLTSRTDEALVSAFVDGDEAAYVELVDRYARRVYGICLRYFGDPTDAEDAAQDAFVALYRRAATFNGTARFSTWMFRVTTNACNDIGRKRARRPQTTARDISEVIDLTATEDHLARRELGIELSAALKDLEIAYRDPIVLHDIVGLGYGDIAERLSLPVGTVKSRVHRGHAKLAFALAHLRGEGARQRPGGRGYEPGEGARQRPGGRGYEPGEGARQRPGGRGYEPGEGARQRPGGRGYEPGEGARQRPGEPEPSEPSEPHT